MSILVVLVLVCLPLFNSANVTTLDDVFVETFRADIEGYMERYLQLFVNKRRLQVDPNSAVMVPFTAELYEYLQAVGHSILTEFSRDLAAVPVQSIYDDLNEHCSQYGETAIEDLTEKPRNSSCVQIRLRRMATSRFKMAVEAGLRQMSRDCAEQRLPFCSVARRDCTEAHGGRMKRILASHIEDWNSLDVFSHEQHPAIKILTDLLGRDRLLLIQINYDQNKVYNSLTFLNISTLSSSPLQVENIIRPWKNNALRGALVNNENNTVSVDELTWGIIKANTGKLDLPCSHYRSNSSRNTKLSSVFIADCFSLNLYQTNAELMVCAYADPESPPLKWLSVPPVYIHSQCLCLAYEGKGCKVKTPQGVDRRLYCLSVLLRDFQRRVSYRPAITYLDYAFQTRVPLCKFSQLLPSAFRRDCKTSQNRPISTECFFKDVVNKDLNCSEALVVDTFNQTLLCYMTHFMQLVLCDDETDEDVRIPFYGAGDSTLVLLLTYVDVAVRVLTLVTYLVCSELRNLPGKLLICYQVTALLRLLVVRASIEDLQVAVRVDVAMDLASTLWLTSYLHFLTACIKALRLPDSLRPDEVRMVLLRYALLGWALPAALSAGFFRMDEVVDSRVQFGQVLFVLCNYAALLGNLYMFFHNGHIYYDVKSSARLLQRGGKARSVFALMFKFALKTSVLSGAGIVFRLVFTQIQGLEHVLGYYHALGTLQGLLLFALYGCSRQARVFWVRVFRSTLSRFPRRQNTPS